MVTYDLALVVLGTLLVKLAIISYLVFSFIIVSIYNKDFLLVKALDNLWSILTSPKSALNGFIYGLIFFGLLFSSSLFRVIILYSFILCCFSYSDIWVKKKSLFCFLNNILSPKNYDCFMLNVGDEACSLSMPLTIPKLCCMFILWIICLGTLDLTIISPCKSFSSRIGSKNFLVKSSF